jgi:hypothetical protein
MEKTDALKNGNRATVSIMLKMVKNLISLGLGLSVFLFTMIFKGIKCMVLVVGHQFIIFYTTSNKS